MRGKSLTDLRCICQAMNIPFTFADDEAQLKQKIELARAEEKKSPDIVPPRPEYDARLMTATPDQMADQKAVKELLQEHISRGLLLEFPEPERWKMRFAKKQDSGNMRMPLRVILGCAEGLMR